jgi:hypothetical protein
VYLSSIISPNKEDLFVPCQYGTAKVQIFTKQTDNIPKEIVVLKHKKSPEIKAL